MPIHMLIMESQTTIVYSLDVGFITPWFSFLLAFLFSLNLTWRLLLSTGLFFLSLEDLLPLTGPLWLP